MNKEEILKYLEALNSELKKNDISGEICIVGGAVMCLCFNSRSSTVDIDAVFEPKMVIYKCVEIIAQQYNLPKNWLNDGVKEFLTTEKDFRSFIEFSNLHVYVATPKYMLAMKCLSARLDNVNEADDIKFLIKLLKISSITEVYEIITKYYPIERFKLKIHYALQEIFESYE